ncbi:GNAT family N-acetyltransferase [Fictibacillus aquaticus]|uniref:GNAT family N-acetyltransferase n=1 Tax=Fictibacillus aquaticus TaxID=2021314 RepID=A0A235FEX5_9BACL|nr:GNAT family N-acetyltransferase [Fictibacillus aquaticus]OYD59325.1 GNAT family N-acetyltransferase [Fictibacillus aquaticus]
MSAVKERVLELTTAEQWKEAYPVMSQLRTDLTELEYVELLSEMAEEGYRLFAWYDGDAIVALAGAGLRINFYNKRHVFIYDLITDNSRRSLGYGEKLLNAVHEWAKENGAHYVSLESGLQRKDAHRFYEEKMGYEKWCYSFRKKL